MNKRSIRFSIFAILVLGFTLAGPSSWAARKKDASRITRNQFFIVSEVNLKDHEVVFEAPTQITATMFVSDKTVITDQHGKRMPITSLRAGDTGYVTYSQDAGGVHVLRFRLGPMTKAELLDHYLNGSPPPVPATAPPSGPPPTTASAVGAGRRPTRMAHHRPPH